jgi:hypothetical protein
MTGIPPLQAGEATIEGFFFGDDGACYARILYRMDPPSEVVAAWERLREQALGLKASLTNAA